MQGLTTEQEARKTVGDGKWITVNPIACFELPFIVCTPDIVGGVDLGIGLAWMADMRASALFGDQAATLEDIADGGTTRPRPAGMTWLKDTKQLFSAPSGMSPTSLYEGVNHKSKT